MLRAGPDYLALLMEAIHEANATGNLVFDAQIAALCRESGVSRLVTEDRDFDWSVLRPWPQLEGLLVLTDKSSRIYAKRPFPEGLHGSLSNPEVVCSQSLPSRDREGAVQ